MNIGIHTHMTIHTHMDDMQNFTHRHDAHKDTLLPELICTHRRSDMDTSPSTYTGMYTKTSSLTLCLAPSCTNKQEGLVLIVVWALKAQGKV